MNKLLKRFLLSVIILIMFNSFAHSAVSDDIYVRKDIFEARMDRLEMLIEKNLTQFRLEVNERFNQLDKKIDNVQSTLDRKIDNVQSTLDRKIENVQSELDKKIEVLSERTEGLKTAIYWGLTIAGMILALAVFGPGLVKIYQMIFKPSLTAEEVEKIFQRLIEANNAKFLAGK